MTSSPENNQDINPLGKLASLIALLAIALYFTGWVYRWAYFGFFQVEVMTLNLPLESFYLAALQALFGHPLAWLMTIITFLMIPIIILISFQLLDSVINQVTTYYQRYALRLSQSQLNLLKFIGSLLDELVIVFWVLIALFVLAFGQGDRDAWRDAVNESSRLPIITVAISDKNAALGRKLNSLGDPSDFRIIGDYNLYNNLVGQELNELEKSRVWRLLIDRDGYFYIFPALPKKDKCISIPVVIIYESGNGDQLTILSPKVSQE